MPNPVFRTNQFSYSFAQPEHLFAKITFGASGAPTIVSGTGMGIISITRSSAGLYVVALSHAYFSTLMVKHVFVNATAPASPSMFITSDASNNSTAPAITIEFNAAGTATDPASGEEVLLEVCLQKSSVRY